MNEPGVTPLIQMMLALERRASFWRGVVVGVVVTLLTAAAGLALAQDVPRAAFEHRRDLIRESRAQWGLAAPTATFAAQIHQESLYRPDARSPAGAQGLAQFMPATARWIGEIYPVLADVDPLNPRWALRALVVYMRHLYDRVDAATDCDRVCFALTAYNGGLGWVRRRQAMSQYPGLCLGATARINPGIAAYNQRENERYPERILLTLEPIYIGAGFGRGACTGG